MDIYQEVDFEHYCPKCKHADKDEKFDPCCECLDYGMNRQSSKPVEYKEKD